MTRSDYYERQAQRLERYTDLAEKKKEEGNNLIDRAHKMADVIPFGQPILVGHYSEGRDRNYRARINNTWDKGFKTLEQAEKYERKADTIINGKEAISSDAPDAIELLKEKLAKCVKFQDDAKTINKIIRKKNTTQEDKIALLISEVGLKEETAKILFNPDCFNETGIPKYKLTNNNAEINRLKARIEKLEKEKTEVSTEIQIGNITITDSVEENRIMITFPGIPDELIRARLKSDGFRWSPTNNAWQAYRTAGYRVPGIISMLTVMPAYITPMTDYKQPSCSAYNLYLSGYWFNTVLWSDASIEEILNLFYDGVHDYPADWISPEMITYQRCEA